MFVITDAHVSEAYGNVDDFFSMLKAVGETDENLVFLGDIFELWIGLKRYEGVIHRDFVRWCKTQQAKRSIGFIEGNHEFYVTRRHRECFTWSSGKGFFEVDERRLWVHGDLINRADKNYLRFRRLTKNFLTKALVYGLPRGPAMVERLKAKLKTTNQNFKMSLPKEAINAYAEAQFARGVKQIIVGHFHQDYSYKDNYGNSLRILPDWFSTGLIGKLTSEELCVSPWQKISG